MALRRDETEAAEQLAVQGLGFLAGDEERLERFLALTGLDPSQIRAMAGSRDFLTAILEHILSDEPLLLAFAAEAGVRPESVDRARQRLAGPLADGLRDG